MSPKSSSAPPRVGMMATVRNRRGIVSAVDAVGGPAGDLRLAGVCTLRSGAGASAASLVW
ncbi:MAG: hypothetical protein ACH37Z_10525 [Anaerolineae bacterium]